MRLIIRIEVVLPQPDGPTKTVNEPPGTSRFRSSTATVPSGYRLVTWLKVIIYFRGACRRRSPVSIAGPPHRGRFRVARHRGVHLGQTFGGQPCRHRVEHLLDLFRTSFAN